jgi:AcrR family transcriptional regulator
MERKQHTRMDPDERKAQLLSAARLIAQTKGMKSVTRVNVAAATGTSVGLISRYFGSAKGLKDAV